MDIYEETKRLAGHLEARGVATWPQRLRDAIEAGSTGTEIIMAIRWNLREMLAASREVLTTEDQACAHTIMREVDSLLKS